MLVFPHAFHGGFNLGINIAEAVNFGDKRWNTNCKDVKICSCL